jgi:PKD domain/Secretion system C-terminal sorting domain
MTKNYLFTYGSINVNGLKKFLLVFLLSFVVASASAQVFVTPAGAGAMNGSSWSNAYSATQLRGALRSATSGSQFWIAAGTYYPGTVKDTSFYINSGVQVYGGFAGTETLLSARNWTLHETIFSGDIGVPGDSTDNTVHVVVFDLNKVDSSTLLDGVTVTRGNGTPDYGGGIYINSRYGTGNAYPVIRHCKITHNNAKYGAGGIYAYCYGIPNHNLRLTLDSCTFQNNHCDSATNRAGGGLLVETDNLATGRLIMTNCTFDNNASNIYGGGAEIRNSSGKSYTTIKKCTFQNNTGDIGGGLGLISYNDYVGGPGGVFNVSIDSCIFNGNKTTSTQGGGIYGNMDFPAVPVVTITNTLFTNNSSPNAAVRYDTKANNAMFIFENDIFRTNSSYIGSVGAYDVESTYNGYDTTRFINCLFDRNRGGVITNAAAEDGKSYVEFVNCTLYDDSTMAASAILSGMIQNYCYIYPAYPNPWVTTVFKNSILYWQKPVGVSAFKNSAHTTVIIANSIVKNCGGSGIGWNTTLGIDSGRNMDVYPLFSDTANYNYNLRCVSPARDTGRNALINPYLSLNDLNGRNRIYNSIVDLGCFEYNAVPPSIAPVVTVGLGGLTINYDNLTTGQEDSVSWDFGDGTFSKYYTGTHTYSSAGTYIICLHVYSCLGNLDSCFPITLVSTLGSNNNVTAPAQRYTVYPNPTNGALHVSGISGTTTYRVLTVTGSMVQQGALQAGDPVIQMGAYSAGIYLVELTSAKGERSMLKVVKQ